MVDVLWIISLTLILGGWLKRRQSWGQAVVVSGAVLLLATLALGWPSFVEGFRDGYVTASKCDEIGKP